MSETEYADAGRSRHWRYLWGRSSTGAPRVPMHYPLLAVLAIVGATLPTTWFLASETGYLIAAAILAAIIGYGVVLTDVRPTTDPVFLLLFGGYWVGLLVHYYHDPLPGLFEYILVTPIAVYATVVILPCFIDGRRETFAMALTTVAVVATLFGLWMLWMAHRHGVVYHPSVATEVMGTVELRTVSIFYNPNTYGGFMMIGGLTALYTYLSRRGVVWLLALGICLLGLVLAEGDAALVGFAIGSVLVVSGRDRWLALVAIAIGVVALYGMIRVGHVPQVMEGTLDSRIGKWRISFQRLAQDPLFGLGFTNITDEIGRGSGPHNSYVHILLNAGIIAGGIYLASLAYALGRGLRKQWTTWNAYVVGLAAAHLGFMMFETLTLGGLGVTSVALGIAVGLMLMPDRPAEGDGTPVTTREMLARSRAARATRRLRDGLGGGPIEPTTNTREKK